MAMVTKKQQRANALLQTIFVILKSLTNWRKDLVIHNANDD
jgi:hypothetical protein